MILIIYSKEAQIKQNGAEAWFYSEAEKLGLDVKIVYENQIKVVIDKSINILIDGSKVSDVTVVHFRCYNKILSSSFELANIPVVNSSLSAETTRDKFQCHLLLNGIPQPKTLFNTNYDFSSVSDELSVPFILKQSYSSKGNDVYLIDNVDDYNKTVSGMKKELILHQEFIEESSGQDIRVLVIDKKPVAAVNRYSENDFRSNYSLGGGFREYQLDDKLIQYSNYIISKLDLDIAGLDFLKVENDYLLCEVNSNPAFRTFWQIGINVPNLILKMLSKHVK